MRSTFKVLFYVNGSKEKDGMVPIMGRITINGSVAQFSCKRTIPKVLWDAKGNRVKGKSKEAIETNYALENIKAQIISITSGFQTVRHLFRQRWCATPFRESARNMRC